MGFAFGCLIHYRPPKPVLKSLAKFSPTTIPGLFLGWHVEPGCGFRGDYLVVALEKFKTPNQTSFHAHRVKEIVTFDATSFPLQAAMVESMIDVSAPTKDGEDIWAESKEQEESSELSRIDAQYMELFGEIPPDDLTFEQKYVPENHVRALRRHRRRRGLGLRAEQGSRPGGCKNIAARAFAPRGIGIIG